MPPPAVPVDSRPPPFSSNFNFNPQNGPSCSFNTGPSSSSVRPKLKPRLVKQRKSSRGSSGPAQAQAQAHGYVDSGVNPFRSVSDASNCCSSDFISNNSSGDEFVGQFENSGFVFGVSNSSSNINCSKVNDYDGKLAGNNEKDREYNNGDEGFTFRFGGVAKEQIGVSNLKCNEKCDDFELMDEMKKLNIESIEKGNCGVGENRRGPENGVSSDTRGGSSTFLESDVNVRNLDGVGEGGSEGKKDGFGSKFGDDVFVFGSNGSFSKLGDFSSECNPVENEGLKVKEELSSSSLLFSMGEMKKEFSSSSMPEGSRESFSDFELPHFDPSMSFSLNFSNGFGRKSGSNVRHRGPNDKNSKKTKGKSKQSKTIKPQPVQIPVSDEGVAQSQEAPECYSPMDFSPYDNTTNSSLPTESQLNDKGTEFNLKTDGFSGDADSSSCGFDKTSEGENKFTFNSSTSSQNHVIPSKRIQRRKYRMKPASISGCTSKVRGFPLDGTPVPNKLQGVDGNIFVSVSENKNKTVGGDELGYEAYSDSEKACEKWRRRGNEAYENKEVSKAEEFYTWGINCVPQGYLSSVSFRPLVRCYSNRAAARMALGRVREAIQDCLMAVELDPSFHRAQIRAANCFLQLGEAENAIHCFEKCLGSGTAVCLDRQVIISASDGIQKCQKLIECTSRSTEILKHGTSDAATDALQYISEAMSISIYSERLLELKAQALCMLSRHEEVTTLCQKTLEFAEKNFTDSNSGCNVVGSSTNTRLWRYHTLAKCQFHLGNLEAALELVEKQEFHNKTQDPLPVTIQELLKQKNAGNSAFHSGKHLEAIEHYTSAIYNSMESRPFAAICFCNRAASYQALGQITDAISDCSLAIALNENYAKAVSRRATLHEMIRDYKQAGVDLQRLLSIHKQCLEKSQHSGSGKGKELRQVQQRLSVVEEEAKKDTLLDLYLILGIKKTDSASEIKKAYRKAALRHHPDKAAQSLVKSGDIGEEGRHWKDIAELVHKDSDRLFKMIGEAYAVLSDSTKREEYDLDEEMRKALKESNNIRTNTRRYSDHYSQGYPFERSSSRRYWQDSYRTYGHSHRR